MSNFYLSPPTRVTLTETKTAHRVSSPSPQLPTCTAYYSAFEAYYFHHPQTTVFAAVPRSHLPLILTHHATLLAQSPRPQSSPSTILCIMHGFKHRAQRLQRGYTAIQARARQGDYEARLKNNIFEARVIAFETSPHRLVPRHAYKNALFATRRLISNSFLLRKSASTQAHHAAINKIEALLLAARDHAMIKSFDVSVAQDVFVLLSHYLGLTAVPEEPPDCNLHTSSFARHKSFITEKVQDQTRKFARNRSSQPGFTRKCNSLVSLEPEIKPHPRFPRSCASFSDLGAEHVEEESFYAM